MNTCRERKKEKKKKKKKKKIPSIVAGTAVVLPSR